MLADDPCLHVQCGANAICRQGQCSCLPEFHGNPTFGCRPECILNTECAQNLACVRQKCIDPCPGTCGSNAICEVHNHVAMCHCPAGMTGNAFVQCSPMPPPPIVISDPCQPSPCGANAQCRNVNGQAICSCLPQFVGVPPSCRPECVSNAECPLHLACLQQRCRDPCPGACGQNAECRVLNHSPICRCIHSYLGNPFIECHPQPPQPPIQHDVIDPCRPSPCGPNSECRNVGSNAQCSCLVGFIGTPPNCRPECVSNADCPTNLACFNQKCRDPCPGVCGSNAECYVINHTPTCNCIRGHTGNPFVGCDVQRDVIEPLTPCVPSPCGSNAICTESNGAGACQCLPEFYGNPYVGCRPECVLNSDCPSQLACLNQHCRDPCAGICGPNAICHVRHHLPQCTCLNGYEGNPYSYCSVIAERKQHDYRISSTSRIYPITLQIALREPVPLNPCQPSPCGPNSKCHEANQQAVCSCLPDFVGTPPACRPECTISSECSLDKTCSNQHCVDPCPGVCGRNAVCRAINHSPHCSCLPGFTGDAFTDCRNIRKMVSPVQENYPDILTKQLSAPAISYDYPKDPIRDPCVPSPCGTFGQCHAERGQAVCRCLPNYYGAPPNCQPECVINSDCASNLSCMSEKCRDPCPGSCGFAAQCSVINHMPICRCPVGYQGNPFISCTPIPASYEPPPRDACNPSPCGSNAVCNNGQCSCLADFYGNAYIGCRPECVLNSDCARDKACQASKCVDPCPGACGVGAICEVHNHVPMCHCPPGTSGNAFVQCALVQRRFHIVISPKICSCLMYISQFS